jgi:hypothetical protein
MERKQDNTPHQLAKIPETLAELDRAIMLLGARVKVELKSGPKGELEKLIGACPNSRVAARWKAELTQLRKERIAAGTLSTEPKTPPQE